MKEQFCSEIKNVFNKHNINLTEKQVENLYIHDYFVKNAIKNMIIAKTLRENYCTI